MLTGCAAKSLGRHNLLTSSLNIEPRKFLIHVNTNPSVEYAELGACNLAPHIKAVHVMLNGHNAT